MDLDIEYEQAEHYASNLCKLNVSATFGTFGESSSMAALWLVRTWALFATSNRYGAQFVLVSNIYYSNRIWKCLAWTNVLHNNLIFEKEWYSNIQKNHDLVIWRPYSDSMIKFKISPSWFSYLFIWSRFLKVLIFDFKTSIASCKSPRNVFSKSRIFGLDPLIVRMEQSVY